MAQGTRALAGISPAPILGICAFRLSAWSVFGGTYLDGVAGAYALSRLAQLAAILAVMLVSARVHVSRRAGVTAVAGASAVMTLAALLCLGRGPQDPLFAAARILHGTCSAVLIMAWGASTCGTPPRAAAVHVSAAFALYVLVTFALQGAPDTIAGAVAVLAPLVSGALFCLAPSVRASFAAAEAETDGGKSECEDEGIPRARRESGGLRGVDWGVALLLLACCLVCSVSDVLVSPGLAGTATYMANAFRVFAFLALAGIFCAWVFALRRDDPDRLWPLFSCTVFFGLLGYSSFSFVNEEASVSFMRATQDCIMLFAWVFTAGTCYRQKLPALVTFGVCAALFMRTDLLSNVLALAGAVPQGHADASVAVGLSFVMAAVLIVYTIALLWRAATKLRESETAAGSGAAASAQALATASTPGGSEEDTRGEEAPAWLAPFGLTAREQQVVGLLLRGYTLPQVGEHLGVSLNTARYYAKAIYRKLGIHSKAELIALAEGRE